MVNTITINPTNITVTIVTETTKEDTLCHLMQRAIVQNVNIFGTNALTKTKHTYALNVDIVISNQKKSIYYPNLRIRVGFFFYTTLTTCLRMSVF